MQGCCLEQSPSEALIQAFLLITTTHSLLPGFGMPTSFLDHVKELIRPHQRFLVHRQQRGLLLADHLVGEFCTQWAEQQEPEVSHAHTAELQGPALDIAQPQSRILRIGKPHLTVPMLMERSLPPEPETQSQPACEVLLIGHASE